MPKISDAQRAAVRGRIIDATIDVASRKGLVDLAMSDIIRESGMSAGAIYGHFDGKDALLIEVAERVMIGRSAELMALAHHAAPHARPTASATDRRNAPRNR